MDAKTLARKAAWREANREKIRKADRLLYQKRKEQVLVHKKAYYQKHADKKAKYGKRRYEQNKDTIKSKRKEYVKKNPGKILALNVKRRADELKRTPKWADLQKIADFYTNRPPGMTVDHIIPLKGKTISGLHIHTNLQYLTRSENSRKNNRF